MIYNEYQALNQLIEALAGLFSQFDKITLTNYEKYGVFQRSLETTLENIDLQRNFIPSLKKMEVQDFHKIIRANHSQRRFYIYLWLKGVTL